MEKRKETSTLDPTVPVKKKGVLTSFAIGSGDPINIPGGDMVSILYAC